MLGGHYNMTVAEVTEKIAEVKAQIDDIPKLRKSLNQQLKNLQSELQRAKLREVENAMHDFNLSPEDVKRAIESGVIKHVDSAPPSVSPVQNAAVTANTATTQANVTSKENA
jgi:chaperonin cofactor prefoldin